MKLDFSVLGEDLAADHLLRVAARSQDLRPAARQIRDLLTKGNAANFASQGSAFGTWPPLAASTQERKRGGDIGVRSGAMKASLEGGRGRSTSATKTQVKVGTKVWYARFFAGGTKTGQPARPIVGVTSTEIAAANVILRRYITEGIV